MRDNGRRSPFTDDQEKDELLALLLEDEGLDIPRQRIAVQPREGEIPLSFPQQRLWFFEQWMPGNLAYLMPGILHLKGTLSIEALEQSLQTIVARHESLRTMFTIGAQGVPIQIIAPSLKLSLPQYDLQTLPLPERQQALHQLTREQMQRPFDLSQLPLLRANLVRLSPVEHVLLLTIHHIICDGWSVEIFIRELAALYSGFVTGQPAGLSQLPIQYADFALWQRQWARSQRFEQLLEYWRKQLAEAPEIIPFPTNYPRPTVSTFPGARYLTRLSPELAYQVKVLCQQCDATPFMILLATFLILLYRYSSQEDLLVGTLIANRTQQELEGLLGFFVNMLVLRVSLDEHTIGKELIERVRDVCLDAYSHQEMPFDHLVEVLHPKRSLAYQSLVQITFQMKNTSSMEVELPGLMMNLQENSVETARFDLSMDVMEEQDTSILLGITYRRDLFEHGTIERMANHYRQLLNELITHPERELGRFALLTQREYQQIVTEWNPGQHCVPQPVCLHGLVAKQAAKTPDALALLFRNSRLSYLQLEQQANQMAHLLLSRGIGLEQPVAVCLERSIQLVVTILGVLKAGTVYIPLDPDYSQAKLTLLLKEMRPALLITQQKFVKQLAMEQKQLLVLDDQDIQVRLLEQPVKPPATPVMPEHLAYIIYTSGSTGQPKGVMIPHRGICNRLLWVQETLRLTDQDRVLQKSPIGFDVSLGEIFLPLIAGSCLVIAEPKRHWDTSYLIQIIVEQNISYAHFVPSMLQVFLETLGVEACKNVLRYIWSGGEVLQQKLARDCVTWLNATIVNGYGPTEASVGVTAWIYNEEKHYFSLPIGRPIENARIYILDRHMHLVPIGIPGELYIGGLPLARGYYQHPEWTAERFVPNPFGPEEGGRLYRTGDIGRYLPDGSIEFLGRSDSQIKIHGLRIELGEIEAVLRQHPGVRQGIVILQEKGPETKRLIAYVVPAQEQRPSSGELHQFMSQVLAQQAVPSAFVFLENLPLTTNGKIDYASLPPTVASAPEQLIAIVAPTNKLERSLVKIWQDLLDLEKIGIDQNFFELGGYSLLMIKMQSKIQMVLKHQVSVLELFQYPTIRTLARYLDQEPAHEVQKVNEWGQKQREAITRLQKRARPEKPTDWTTR